jgi:hypothetical protein
MDIIRERFSSDGYEVLSDEGWIPVHSCGITHSFRKYVVLFESGTTVECADRHVFIDENREEVFAKDLGPGDRILSESGVDPVFDVFDMGEDENFFDLTMERHNHYYTNGILSHNSGFMINTACRQALRGYTPVIFTLEMSEDMVAQRMDSIFSGLDINRIYTTKRSELVPRLKDVKAKEGRGDLFIKQFPTGTASINDFRAYLHELAIRGIEPDIIYCDYVNLMRPSYTNRSNMYEDVKRIAEELRALGFEFKVPVVSVTQLNREGSNVSLSESDFTYVAESMGVAATCDFMFILGVDSDLLTYRNELHYKITKNRLGGRVGEIDKFYFDNRSLKIYDVTELDQWLADERVSAGSREIFGS